HPCLPGPGSHRYEPNPVPTRCPVRGRPSASVAWKRQKRGLWRRSCRAFSVVLAWQTLIQHFLVQQTGNHFSGHAPLAAVEHFALVVSTEPAPIADLHTGTKTAHADVIRIQCADGGTGRGWCTTQSDRPLAGV